MQFDANYGVIIDSFSQILNNNIQLMQIAFSDANDVTSPIYAVIYEKSKQDYVLQQAIQTLWNCINANTANGLGLAILANAITNLNKKGLVPSSVTIQFVVTLGSASSVTIPSDWPVTASGISNSPVYTPRQSYTYTSNGTYNIICYSDNIITNISAAQLNTAPTLDSIISGVTNPQANLLGSPIETNAQFAARRKYYLNIEGQTYYGLEKAILNLNIAALRAVFVAETIQDSVVSGETGLRGSTIYLEYPTLGPIGLSRCLLTFTVTLGVAASVTIPSNWAVTASTVPGPTYTPNQEYTYTNDGTYNIWVYSTNTTTTIAANKLDTASTLGGIVGSLDNAAAAILGQDTFDTNDLNLQNIAQTAYNYHPQGTNYYRDDLVGGATLFNVQTPYGSYTSQVYLNPIGIQNVGCVLTFVYNTDPRDAGFGNQVFPINLLPNLKQNILNIINTYFRSKTLPTDLMFTINELSEIIQNSFTGIVDLKDFSFTTFSPSATGLTYLIKGFPQTPTVGYIFNLESDDFTFTAESK